MQKMMLSKIRRATLPLKLLLLSKHALMNIWRWRWNLLRRPSRWMKIRKGRACSNCSKGWAKSELSLMQSQDKRFPASKHLGKEERNKRYRGANRQRSQQEPPKSSQAQHCQHPRYFFGNQQDQFSCRATYQPTSEPDSCCHSKNQAGDSKGSGRTNWPSFLNESGQRYWVQDENPKHRVIDQMYWAWEDHAGGGDIERREIIRLGGGEAKSRGFE